MLVQVQVCDYVITYLQEWKPRYGYKRANDESQDWLLEVPQNAGTIGHNKDFTMNPLSPRSDRYI